MARDLTYLRIDTIEYTSPAVILQFTSTLFVNRYLFYYEKNVFQSFVCLCESGVSFI